MGAEIMTRHAALGPQSSDDRPTRGIFKGHQVAPHYYLHNSSEAYQPSFAGLIVSIVDGTGKKDHSKERVH